MKDCRFCHTPLNIDHGADLVLDLGVVPLANDLRSTREEAVDAAVYPLTLVKCGRCSAFVLTYAVDKERLFRDYNYATPDMSSLTKHYERVQRFLGDVRRGNVLEIGGNNGAFLRTFRLPDWGVKINVEPARNIPCPNLGDDKCKQVMIREFFSKKIAQGALIEHGKMDLIVARHCFAHIDDLDEVCAGVSELLESSRGIFYIENAYGFATMLGLQFDQVYHEHMSYLTVGPLQHLLGRHGMRVFKVAFSDVHGGSIMVGACKDEALHTDDMMPMWLLAEQQHLFHRVDHTFNERTRRVIDELADLFDGWGERKKVVDVYGATAKSTTLLNVVKNEATDHFIPNTHMNVRRCYDRAELKVGKFMPGTGIPIVHEARMIESPPDYCVITAWNYADEIMEREKWYTEQGGKWVLPLPEVRIIG